MSFRNFISVIVILALISVFGADAKPDLKCNICFVDKNTKGKCQVMPCTNLQEAKMAYAALTKQQTDMDIDPETMEIHDAARDKNAKFVCVKSVTFYKDSPTKDVTVTSSCTIMNAKYKPSTKPYPASEMMKNVDLKAKTEDDWMVKYMKERVVQIEGDYYVCDDKVGQGPNCGPKASMAQTRNGIAKDTRPEARKKA